MIDRKDIFMSGFKSKIGYSFTYKDLNEFEAIIDFYEQQCKKQKEVIDKAIKYIQENMYSYYDNNGEKCIEETVFERSANPKVLLDILKEVLE